MENFILIMKMKQGDEAAFEKFVRKYYGAILQYCRYHCPDRASAEDLTQETFLKFFGSLCSYRHMGKAKNYLYTIAGNLCKNQAKRKLPVPMEITDLEWKTQETAVDVMAETEREIDVTRALEQLPAEFREVIILFYFQECKLTEIAEILQIGLPLVKYRLKRAKEELKRILGEEETYGHGANNREI